MLPLLCVRDDPQQLGFTFGTTFLQHTGDLGLLAFQLPNTTQSISFPRNCLLHSSLDRRT